MGQSQIEINDIHWLMDILQNIDVGLVVLDRNYDIQLWNAFMDSHSGVSPQVVKGKNLFKAFPEISESWFRQKAEPVFELKTRTFTIWEQRPYLFKFANSRPITGRTEFMYQNTSIIPLESVTRNVDHICVIIYDVTDTAVGKQDAIQAQASLDQLRSRDSLTGLLQRSDWMSLLDVYCDRVRVGQQEGVLMLVDLDHFRDINRLLSISAGDDIIRRMGQGLRNLPGGDTAVRLGGEMFGIILKDHTLEQATRTAERLRRSVGQLVRSQDATLTASISLAAYNRDMRHGEDWLHCAENALYQAKNDGRDQVLVYQPNVE